MLAIVLAACSLISIAMLDAKIEVVNNTDFEIKGVVTWDGGWFAYPAGAVRKEGGKFVPDDAVNGIMPGEWGWTKKDLSNVKKHWEVWAKIEGKWSKKPVINRNKAATGGIIQAPRANVTNRVDDDGKPIFDISIEQGW